jgi:hypothetical protein
MKPPGIAIDTFKTTLMVAHGREAPTVSEWQQLVAAWRSHPELTSQLVLTLGGGPNVVQRRESLELLNSRPGGSPDTAVLTDSIVVRGMVTALSWFATGRLAAFSLDGLDAALSFLRIEDRAQRSELRQRLVALRRTVEV